VTNMSRKNLSLSFTRISKRLLLSTQKKEDRLDRFFVETYRKETCSAGLEFSLNMRILFESLMSRHQLGFKIFSARDEEESSLMVEKKNSISLHLSLDSTTDDGIKIVWCASSNDVDSSLSPSSSSSSTKRFVYEIQLKDETDPQGGVFSTIHTSPVDDMTTLLQRSADDEFTVKDVESLSISPLSRERSYALRVLLICVEECIKDEEEKEKEKEEKEKKAMDRREIISISNVVVAEPHMSPAFAFDTNACGPNIEISSNGLTCKNVTNKKWNSVRAHVGPGLSTGVHQWEVRIDKCVSKNIFIGIAGEQADLANYVGSDRHGWGYLANKAIWHKKAKLRSYGLLFREDDVVRVMLDMNRGTLEFALNGTPLGLALPPGELCGLKLFPIFSLYVF